MKRYIYVPGLGDHFDWLRRIGLKAWAASDSRVSFVPSHWNRRSETFDVKVARIRQVIEQHPGDEIILVGESAGGALALYTYLTQPDAIGRVVTIAGYNHGFKSMSPHYRISKPAFYHLMQAVDEQVISPVAAAAITTIYSTEDTVVTPSHTRIAGADEIVLTTKGHFTTIAHSIRAKLALKI